MTITDRVHMTGNGEEYIGISPGFPISAGAELWQWLNSPRKPNFDDFGVTTEREFMEQLECRVKTEKTWAIDLDGKLVGYAAFLPQSPSSGQFHGLVIAPGKRHRGLGTEAMRMVVDQLRSEGFRQIVAAVFADNEPVSKMFRTLGFAEDGILTAATRRDGEPLDARVFKRT